MRRELLDGVLLVPPCRTDIHQIIAMRLMVALEGSCPIAFQVTQGMEVRMGRQALYAAAGIPHYWVIDTDNGLVVHVHKLDPQARTSLPATLFDDEIQTAEPWPIKLPVKRLTPRYL
ncbi:hypothetical protein SAMN05421748_112252 [Paractinoplanes atraurantiacus]|uniref:Restriction endonuclease n=1 Tax=Paractinoplanes atraurantiacus TaxID=1036182 RepID=A0A285IYX2_9ACTN|nr:hypothetical protein SAMN05421748_112252 [Actinoplanes atraurantiacus]